jgi:hypothetical protein
MKIMGDIVRSKRKTKMSSKLLMLVLLCVSTIESSEKRDLKYLFSQLVEAERQSCESQLRVKNILDEYNKEREKIINLMPRRAKNLALVKWEKPHMELVKRVDHISLFLRNIIDKCIVKRIICESERLQKNSIRRNFKARAIYEFVVYGYSYRGGKMYVSSFNS